MGNIKKWICEWLEWNKLSIEDIEEIVLGGMGDYFIMQPPTVKPVKEALKELDVEFDSGYGGEEGRRFYVYLKDWILLKCEYDGSESLSVVPRNPNHSFEVLAY